MGRCEVLLRPGIPEFPTAMLVYFLPPTTWVSGAPELSHLGSMGQSIFG